MKILRRDLLALIFLALALVGCKSELYSNLEEREANEMLAVLAKSGIVAKKTFSKKQNFVLTVDEGDMADAIQLLNRLGYPRDTYTDMGQVFQKDGLISSPLEERARYIYAVSQDLSDTLARVDGVIDAKVHVVLPETDVTGDIVKPPSASIFLKHQAEFNLQPFIPKIKLLVNKSIEGIDYQDISIALFPSDVNAVTDRAQWSNFLGIKVQPSSKGRLVMLFGLLLALVVVSMLVNIALSRRGKESQVPKSPKGRARRDGVPNREVPTREGQPTPATARA